jgi:hypothetical protein
MEHNHPIKNKKVWRTGCPKLVKIRTVPQDYLGSPIQKEGSHLSCSWLNTWNPTYREKNQVSSTKSVISISSSWKNEYFLQKKIDQGWRCEDVILFLLNSIKLGWVECKDVILFLLNNINLGSVEWILNLSCFSFTDMIKHLTKFWGTCMYKS